jgi:hypothetical protein
VVLSLAYTNLLGLKGFVVVYVDEKMATPEKKTCLSA